MSKLKEEQGFNDGYAGNDIAYPNDSDYLKGYGRGYEQAEKDSYFTKEHEEINHES